MLLAYGVLNFRGLVPVLQILKLSENLAKIILKHETNQFLFHNTLQHFEQPHFFKRLHLFGTS